MTPEQIKLCIQLAICAIALAAAAAGGWMVNGWRLGKDLEHQKALTAAAVDQGKVLSDGLSSCNASIDGTRKTAQDVLKVAAEKLEQAIAAAKGHQAAVGRIEDLLRKGTPAGAGCREAWAAIEAMARSGQAGAPTREAP